MTLKNTICLHKKTEYIPQTCDIFRRYCKKCKQELEPKKLYIVGFGIVKESDIEHVDAFPREG